jgi:hypothetical protein
MDAQELRTMAEHAYQLMEDNYYQRGDLREDANKAAENVIRLVAEVRRLENTLDEMCSV